MMLWSDGDEECWGLLQARQQLKEMVWIKSSENMVLEAMYRLSGLHDALEELLRVQLLPMPTYSAYSGKEKAAVPMSPVSPPKLGGSPHAVAPGSGRVLAQAARFSHSEEAGPSNPDYAGLCSSAWKPILHMFHRHPCYQCFLKCFSR